ncbi:polysaccharide biosynthesis/export family protein [Croceimicrobium sp.]|uniref:polysaccharide biosynthesis/export family protein n=1 Tax=Croceimicrobium sp. TaxID=2828340 RepID=UPI003BAC915B
MTRTKSKMWSRFFKATLYSLLLIGAIGCVPTKRLTYLQEEEGSSKEYKLERNAYRVQPNDILSITIRTYDAETSQLFNIANMSQPNALQAGDILFYLQGYSIDLNGEISIPIVGKLQVLDLSIEEIQNLVETELQKYFTEESINVTVQLAGIRFSIVGEVARPGKYVVYQNQVNIFEALASAGDITIVGDRKEVMVVRQSPEGVKTFVLDLTDANVINDSRYFIQPNDVINVKPLPQKSFGIGTTGFQTFSQLLSVLASTITLIIAINSINN